MRKPLEAGCTRKSISFVVENIEQTPVVMLQLTKPPTSILLDSQTAEPFSFEN